jgi:ribokinase
MPMIVVFGSMTVDMNVVVPHLPTPGETVLSPTYEWMPGGKGANQAISAARAGAKVAMVGKIGDDGFGTRVVNNLKRESILASGVARSSDMPTGCATVFIDQSSGENQIVVAAGANLEATSEQAPKEILGKGNVVLMQMEVEHEENWNVIRTAYDAGALTILNMAPAAPVPKEILDKLDILVVNSIEARQIAEKLGLEIEGDAIKLANVLAKQCNLTCLITLGEQGSVAVEAQSKMAWVVPAMKLETVVDTTGAGDAFCGAFAAALFKGRPIQEAMRFGSVAGSLACRGKGAQASVAYEDEINDHLKNLDQAQEVEI